MIDFLQPCKAEEDKLVGAMNHIYLKRHDPDKNLHLFYQMYVTPGIRLLIRESGRAD
ncbi:hypothetical protein ABXJ76_07305 [Methylobacter sp. G7]|uniref:hypothetical protein n=1 Tax=Methylobacter sp. G7 TaxID=3230117 RepID=UPI003D802349